MKQLLKYCINRFIDGFLWGLGFGLGLLIAVGLLVREVQLP